MTSVITATVTVYTAGPGCVMCRMTKMHLDRRGIAYHEVSLDTVAADDPIHTVIREQGYVQAPVVQAGDQVWNMYRPDRIDGLLP